MIWKGLLEVHPTCWGRVWVLRSCHGDWEIQEVCQCLEVMDNTYHINADGCDTTQKPLPPQGLFISSIKLTLPQTPSNTWHHLRPPPQILRRFPCQNQPQLFPLAAKQYLTILHFY